MTTWPVWAQIDHMTPEELALATDLAIGRHLRDERTHRKMSRARLAALTEDTVSARTVQRIENAERSADFSQLSRILAALDLPLEAFVTEALRKYPPTVEPVANGVE